MKDRVSIEGRSLVFNIVFVVLNLTGLTFLVLGNHEAFEAKYMLFNTIGLILMILSTGGMIIFKGKLLMSSVSRVLVGGLFIVSGLVKANDPLGFSYKLEEYFEDGALAFRIKEWFGAPGFSMEFFMDFALLLSILICIVEIVLGVLTIIGGKIKLVSYLMVFMMLFFTFLTWHTANCDGEQKFVDRDTYAMTDPVAAMKIEESKTNKELKIISQSKTELVVEEMKLPQCVDDCGCFGDALKGSVGRSLTPSESLWKDIILLYLVIWIFAAQWQIKPNIGKENMIYLVSSMLVIVFFSWVFGWYFPILFGLISILGALWIKVSGGKLLGNYWGSSLIVSLFCGILVSYVMMYEPLKDYRPYAVGSDLEEKMNDGVQGVYENMLVYKNKKTGKTKEYNATSAEYTESKIWEDKDWEYVEMIQKEIVPSTNPSIMDFNPILDISVMTDYEKENSLIKSILDTSQTMILKILDLGYNSTMDVPIEEYSLEGFPTKEYKIQDTLYALDPNLSEVAIKDAVLKSDKLVVVITRRLNEANWANLDKLKAIKKACDEKGVPFIIIGNAVREEINAFREKNKFEVPFFVMDEIELKVITRSNPALLVFDKGVVTGKYPFRSTPGADSFKSDHLK